MGRNRTACSRREVFFLLPSNLVRYAPRGVTHAPEFNCRRPCRTTESNDGTWCMGEHVDGVPLLDFDRVQQAQAKVARLTEVRGRRDRETFSLALTCPYTVTWMLLNSGENSMRKTWSREAFPQARRLRATSFTTTCQSTSWHTETIFTMGRHGRRKHVHARASFHLGGSCFLCSIRYSTKGSEEQIRQKVRARTPSQPSTAGIQQLLLRSRLGPAARQRMHVQPSMPAQRSL